MLYLHALGCQTTDPIISDGRLPLKEEVNNDFGMKRKAGIDFPCRFYFARTAIPILFKH
jgi:hypothetical protein